jgi:hypothetical protein
MRSPLPFRTADHAESSTEDRTMALAALLATALLRLQPHRTFPADSGHEKPSEFRTNDLAVGGEKSVTVHAG